MAAPNLLTCKCRTCGQTIFSDAAKCQFCGTATSNAPAGKGGPKLNVTYVDEVGSADTTLKVCCYFWILWNCLSLFGIVRSKLAENAGTGPHVQNNTLGLPLGMITALALIGCAIGMLGKNPPSLQRGVFVSVIGSIILTPLALAMFYATFTGQPGFFLYGAFSLVGAVATFATRWAAKRV